MMFAELAVILCFRATLLVLCEKRDALCSVVLVVIATWMAFAHLPPCSAFDDIEFVVFGCTLVSSMARRML
jgi:hypothetical protein